MGFVGVINDFTIPENLPILPRAYVHEHGFDDVFPAGVVGVRECLESALRDDNVVRALGRISVCDPCYMG